MQETTKKNLINEIFHTFGLSHPENEGASQGIHHYPPLTPTDEDAKNAAESEHLPRIER